MSMAGAVRRAAIVALAGLLAACTTPPGGPPGEGGEGGDNAKLQPLARQPARPAGAPARSTVASVRYDLAVGGAGDFAPDDGLPGDGAPGEIYQRGGASWYGLEFHNRRTASGERFDMGAFTAAHKSLPFGTRVCVRSLVNGREVLVRVNDRGPFTPGRIIDLSRAAAESLDLIGLGIKQVTLSVVSRDGARCGGQPVPSTEAMAAADADRPPPVRPQRAAPARNGRATKTVPARRKAPSAAR